MTEVHLSKSPVKHELLVMGHCNAGRINGMDLCCCAVSMLVYTIMDTLSKFRLTNPTLNYAGGWCNISFGTDSPDLSKATAAIDTIMNGFRLLANSYPANIKIYQNEKEDSYE